MKVLLLCLFASILCDKSFGEEFFVDDPLEGIVMESIFGDDGCHCIQDKCSCCKKLSLPRLHVSKAVCIELVYINTEQSFKVQLTVDGSVIFDKKVHGKNPRPVCGKIPIIGHRVNMCIELADIKMDTTGLRGCINLVATIITEHKFKIGCFKLPTATRKDEADILIYERKVEIRN
ncbi:uncharacterized protein LOC125663441 [Ostrea edulis]|uniref:uncharacterized protein LOC125663441 n=1 Tax=Ostrea edulis TaxID=37623 RepID=UPI0024AF3859|nr:uncharacterized protein LOC125663441 [Ostrea edulis]